MKRLSASRHERQSTVLLYDHLRRQASLVCVHFYVLTIGVQVFTAMPERDRIRTYDQNRLDSALSQPLYRTA